MIRPLSSYSPGSFASAASGVAANAARGLKPRNLQAIVGKLKVPQLRPSLLSEPQPRPILCVSMNQGLDYIPRVEALVRMGATLPEVEIGEVVDYMELKREANYGKFVWLMRFRLTEAQLPYLLCHKPLRDVSAGRTDGGADGGSRVVFNPISWSAFGAPMRHEHGPGGPDASAAAAAARGLRGGGRGRGGGGGGGGMHVPYHDPHIDFEDIDVVNSLRKPEDILAALERDKIPMPHQRRNWEQIDFNLLERPTQLYVYARDAKRFLAEMRHYLGLPTAASAAASQEEIAEEEQHKWEFGPGSNSGQVVLEFACPSEALMVYDVLEKKKLSPSIKVFHTAADIEAAIQSEYARLTDKHTALKRARVKPTFDHRFGLYDEDSVAYYKKPAAAAVEEQEEEDDAAAVEAKGEADHAAAATTTTATAAGSTIDYMNQVYGQFVIESQIAMRTDPTISRVEISSLRIASTEAKFDMRDPELYKQNKLYSGSLDRMLDYVHEPVFPDLVFDDTLLTQVT